jgi:holin-like protein
MKHISTAGCIAGLAALPRLMYTGRVTFNRSIAMHKIQPYVLLAALCIAAEGLALVLPLPSGILGMLLLFALLLTRAVKTESIERPADMLLQNMALVFVPSGVQIVQNLAMSGTTLLKFIFIIVAAAFCTFFACAKTVQLALRLTGPRKEGKANG